jgi:hypothetical protein
VSPARAFFLLSILASAPVTAVACGFPTSGLTPGTTASGGAGSSSSGAGASGGIASGGAAAGGSAPACATGCERIPEGWTLVRVRTTDPAAQPDASAPTCAGGEAPAVYLDGPAPAACTPCSCGAPMGAACGAPQITCSYSVDDCSTNDLQRQDSSATCSTYDPGVLFSNSSGSCELTAPAMLTTPGTCAASGGAPTPASPWAGAVVVCPETETGPGCASGESCVPTGATADGVVCITRADTTPCPAAWTAQVTAAFEGGTDGRACSACACDVQCTGGSYDVYTQDFCLGSASVTIGSTTCTAAPGVFDWSTSSVQSNLATPTLASCDGAVPSGAVETTGPHQICCR